MPGYFVRHAFHVNKAGYKRFPVDILLLTMLMEVIHGLFVASTGSTKPSLRQEALLFFVISNVISCLNRRYYSPSQIILKCTLFRRFSPETCKPKLKAKLCHVYSHLNNIHNIQNDPSETQSTRKFK